MGQKNCSIKDEDELAQIIGNYRMTSDLQWVDLKSGTVNQLKEIVVKKDSYSSDSLDEFCEESSPPDTDKSKTGSDEHLDFDMSNDKCLSQMSSDINSIHDNTSITSTYSFEIVEETESLQTDNITESIDIRISPCNSTVMSLNCSNNFHSEFSQLDNVDVQISHDNTSENFENTKDAVKSGAENQVENELNGKEELNNKEDFCNVTESDENETAQEILSADTSANNDINTKFVDQPKNDFVHEISTQQKQLDITTNLAAQKKTEYYANKIEITTKQERIISSSETNKQEKVFSSEKAKQKKRISSSVEKKIAEEIKQMREREEELRVMREKMAKEMSEKTVLSKTANSDTPVLPKSEKVISSSPVCDVFSASPALKNDNGLIKACVFAIKRKGITLKTDSSEMNNKSPCAITRQESHVERDIRIAKEREESHVERDIRIAKERKESPVERDIRITKEREESHVERDIRIAKERKESPVERDIRITKEREESHVERDIRIAKERKESPVERDIRITKEREESHVERDIRIAKEREESHVERDIRIAKERKESPVERDIRITKEREESHVERDIRIAKEREEELKREREQAFKTKLEMDSLEFGTNETDADSALSICSDSSFDSVSKLAPLFQRNGSPEINNSNGISVYSSSAGSICSLESLSQRHRSQSVGGSMNGSILSPSPDSPYIKPTYPFATPRNTAEKRNKIIDMERFITSKGKEIKFKKETVNIAGFHNIYELKPPQVKKGEEMTCKRFVTAAAKIQNELKEMQEREEEFKKYSSAAMKELEKF